MRTLRAGILALIMTVGSFAMFVPSVGAVDVGCQDMGANGAILAVPGAGIAGFGWTPDCAVIDNGSTVTFAQVDGFGHFAVADGCFATRQLTTSPQGVAIEVVDGVVVANGEECSDQATQPRTGRVFDFSGPQEPVIEMTETTATIYFICGIHGPVMHGKIIVPL